MNIRKMTGVCLNLLAAIVIFTVLYCVNYGVSWVNNLSYTDMLMVTVPFVVLALLSILAYGIVSERIEEKRQREIRRRQRRYIVRTIHRNRNKIIYLRKMPKLELFKEAC